MRFAHSRSTYSPPIETFVLQHWEGDWAIRGSYKPEETPAPQAIEGMTGWLNARQDGVDAARKAVRAENVHVYHAAEVNAADSPAFGAKNVYIGEYGLPENDAGVDAVRDVVTHVTDAAVAWAALTSSTGKCTATKPAANLWRAMTTSADSGLLSRTAQRPGLGSICIRS